MTGLYDAVDWRDFPAEERMEEPEVTITPVQMIAGEAEPDFEFEEAPND